MTIKEYNIMNKLVDEKKIRSRNAFHLEMIRRHGPAILEGKEPPVL